MVIVTHCWLLNPIKQNGRAQHNLFCRKRSQLGLPDLLRIAICICQKSGNMHLVKFQYIYFSKWSQFRLPWRHISICICLNIKNTFLQVAMCICRNIKMFFSNRQYVFVQLSKMAGLRTIYFAASGPSLGSHEDRFIEDLLVLHCSKSAPHKKNNLNWLWIVLCLSVFRPQRKLGRIFEPNIFFFGIFGCVGQLCFVVTTSYHHCKNHYHRNYPHNYHH